jgi:hypothetical protein
MALWGLFGDQLKRIIIDLECLAFFFALVEWL